MNRVKAAYFDRMATAPWAIEDFRPEDQPKIDRLLAAAEMRPGLRVLEPGCGTGRLTVRLADAVGPTGRLVALDISAKMVQACLDRLGQRSHVVVIQAALENCPVGPASFEVAICHQVFPHFDDPAAACATLTHALRPGGRLVVVHFANATVINEIHRTAATLVQHDRLPSPAEMGRLLAGAGLVVDWCTDDDLGYCVRGTRPRLVGG